MDTWFWLITPTGIPKLAYDLVLEVLQWEKKTKEKQANSWRSLEKEAFWCVHERIKGKIGEAWVKGTKRLA